VATFKVIPDTSDSISAIGLSAETEIFVVRSVVAKAFNNLLKSIVLNFFIATKIYGLAFDHAKGHNDQA
jgi:hypothetical protein